MTGVKRFNEKHRAVAGITTFFALLLIIVIRIIIAVRRKKHPKPRKSNPEPQMPKWRGTAPDSEDKQDAPEKDEDSGKL